MIIIAGITLSYSTVFIGLYWLVAGAVCTLLTTRRGMYIAVVAPLIVSVVPAIVRFGPGFGDLNWAPFGGDFAQYVNRAMVPFFACVVGALIGELILPSEEEE